MIQSQVDFHNLEDMIENEVWKEECEKTKIRHDFLKDIRKILQHNQFKYKIMLCISLERKKIIHQKYITLNNEYIFSEFYVQARQLQEKLWKYDFSQCSEKWLMMKSMTYNQLWQKRKKSV